MSKIQEPLLVETQIVMLCFPLLMLTFGKVIKHKWIVFGEPEEVDLSKDYKDWEKLTDNEKYFIKMVLAFFAASDGIVLENLGMRFMSEVQMPEARAFYGFQIMMENVHSEMYSILIDSYIKNEEEKTKCFTAIENFPCIKKKAEWIIKWINDKRSSFPTRLIAFACVEGIFLVDHFVPFTG